MEDRDHIDLNFSSFIYLQAGGGGRTQLKLTEKLA